MHLAQERAGAGKATKAQPSLAERWLMHPSTPTYPEHVWSYDFAKDRTHEGRKLRILPTIDDVSRECLASSAARRLRSQVVLAASADQFVTCGPPACIRSDNRPQFIAKAVQHWLGRIGMKTLTTNPGSPWESRYCYHFNRSLRGELLDGGVIYTLAKAGALIEGSAPTQRQGPAARATWDIARRLWNSPSRQCRLPMPLRFTSWQHSQRDHSAEAVTKPKDRQLDREVGFDALRVNRTALEEFFDTLASRRYGPISRNGLCSTTSSACTSGTETRDAGPSKPLFSPLPKKLIGSIQFELFILRVMT